jgi:SAM-dependent methyltransferase
MNRIRGLTWDQGISIQAPPQRSAGMQLTVSNRTDSMNDTYTEWKHWEADQFGQWSRSDGRYFSWCIAQAKLSPPPTRVLEIGFGNGAFLGYCRDRGWTATGIETSETLISRATSAGFPVFSAVVDLPDGLFFDLIAVFDVLEHLPIDQAQGMLSSLRAVLSPQGAMLLRVPNGDSPFGRAYQHGDRTHVETYGSEKLHQLCACAQLRIVHAGEAPWSSQHRIPRTLRTFLGSILKRLIDWIIGCAYFGHHVDLSPNLFVVIKPAETPHSKPNQT